MTPPDCLTLIAAVVICLRLLTFRRQGHRVRRLYSWAAWLIIAGTGSAAIRILAGHSVSTDWGIALVFAVLATLVMRHGGNIACLFRPPRKPQ